MKRRIIGLLIIVSLFVTSCSSAQTKTYVLEDVMQDDASKLNIGRIYDYCYNICSYGNEDLVNQPSAFWAYSDSGRIIINEADSGDNSNYIKSMVYGYGFYSTVQTKKWMAYEKPKKVSPNGEYMVYEMNMSDGRYIMLYDYMFGKKIFVDKVDPKYVPYKDFELEICWNRKGTEFYYGWKYTGDSQYVVALDENYYYNDWRYGKEEVYKIKNYNVNTRKDSVVYEFYGWKFHEKIYDYTIQINENDDMLVYSKEDKWLYWIKLKEKSSNREISKVASPYGTYWLCSQGIYVQGEKNAIEFFDFKTCQWSEISDTVNNEISSIVSSHDGSILYFSERQRSNNYVDYTESNVWDIYSFRVDKKELNNIYQGADNLIGISLSPNGENLMMEMRDISSRSQIEDLFLTRVFVFQSIATLDKE